MDPSDDPVLSRRYLLEGRLNEMVHRVMPGAVLLTQEQRDASLRETLAARPDRGQGAWLFCYGSLIWNPTIRSDAHRTATIAGWHRAFCLATRAGRGTPDNPGLVLGLMPGASCTGLILHIAEDALVAELELLWRREMLSGAYVPAWLALDGQAGDGAAGHALAFTINVGNENVVDWPEDRVVRTLATAGGELGTSAEYLLRTREGLRARGIHDEMIERLAVRVAAVIGES